MSKLNWLSQNAKMKRSSTQYDIYNWGIPAFKSQDGTFTCPNAKNCVSGCYARSGAYNYSNVVSKYESRLELARSPRFETEMMAEIETVKAKAKKRGKQCLIRIHDSGDWFNLDYTMSWFRMIRQHSDIVFYSYTKQVEMFKDLTDIKPENLIMIYSYGGKQDHLIDPKRDRHSLVFQNETELLDAGYADASHNDTVAIGECLKIGLTYHGNKRYDKTRWKSAFESYKRVSK